MFLIAYIILSHVLGVLFFTVRASLGCTLNMHTAERMSGNNDNSKYIHSLKVQTSKSEVYVQHQL